MKQLIEHLAFTLIFLSVAVLTSAQLTKSDIDKAIDIPFLKHPYLYFSEKEKPELQQRIKNDQECNDIFNKLKAQANMWLQMPVDKNIPIQGKNTRAGWSEFDRDGKYSNYYNTNRNNAFYLAFLYQMTGEQKYADKAFEFADAFCDLTTWTQRAHEFPIIYSRIMPWNVNDDQVNFNFDHYNGDSGRMMAAVYDWLYLGLNVAQRDRIRGALIEKVVTRVRGNYEFHWWATAYRCNWCGVCNSGVGLTGLALLTENPQLTDIVAESYNRINNMFNELGENGGWQEGGGYWNYGIHTSTFFADALKRITNGKYNLFENKRLKSNPVNFPLYISLQEKRSLNFEDSGGSGLIGSTHLINKLATETNSKVAAWYRTNLLGAGNDIFDIIWPRPEIKPEPPKNPSIHFRTIDWWVMRSDFKDPKKVIVAGKAGKNDDPHHGHLDIGNFIVHWQGEYFIRDLGSGSYDEKYFDNARWDYPQASSAGHNVVFVNGEKQIPGKLRKQPYNFEVGGKVVEFRTSEKRDYVLMNPTKAYPNKELKGWRRHIVLEKPEITIVLDEIKAYPGAKIEVRFHPGVDFEIKKDFVFLKGEKGEMAFIPIVKQQFEIQQGKHASQFINATKDFSWIDYFDTEVKAQGEKTIVATLILPVTNSEEAQKIVASKQIKQDKLGDLSLSFKRKGISYLYEFNLSDDGLILKK
ncbi:MAG: heparinase II/III-family protein [Draconibacterium sp.]|nr:heparinase II/III-family protein [Draconibacterium sp.]